MRHRDAPDPPIASPAVDPRDTDGDNSRAGRLAERRGWRRRVLLATGAVVLTSAAFGAWAIVAGNESADARGDVEVVPTSTTASSTSTSTSLPPTTTTTIPAVAQPADVVLPGLPFGPLSQGNQGPVVQAYEQRMKDLHLDPGPVDGVFDQATRYAVEAVAKYLGLPRDGIITAEIQTALQHWVWSPAMPTAEGDRVEIDLDRQVLTVFKAWQPILLTTTSTGSGEHFCGGDDGCQYAITPAGRYEFTWRQAGWQKGKLGRLYSPYYFNGGIAVHGYTSVPTHPASHGCARIPMHVAEYFADLVAKGEPVYVVGTPMKPGDAYVGPSGNSRTPATVTTPPPPPPTVPPTTPATAPPVTAAPTTKPAPPTTPPTSPPTTVAPTTPTT
jgi:peptidoglycan hydrolase-like protein with peptidoglycan-binding domain